MAIEQKLLIQYGEWDYLIVLDACRYDYFEKKINKFFQGDLIETTSSGSCTIDWCKKTFNTKNFQNTVYISSNPYINSKKEVLGFHASKIYKEVIDVWLYGWDDDLGTVFPSKITEAAKRALKNNPEKMIIHYLQPHAPYLDDTYRTIKYDEPLLEINRFLDIIYDRNSKISFIQMVASKISPKLKANLSRFTNTIFSY